MERIREFTHSDKNFISIDFSGIHLINGFCGIIEQVELIIKKYPKKSVYTITNINNTTFDSKIIAIFVDYLNFNKPYVIKGAIIGIDGIKKIMATNAMELSQRSNLLFCFSEEEAVNLLLDNS